jgi:dihydrofolate reductase
MPANSATYTWDVFCSLDGFGSYNEKGDWGGYWGKQGPEFLERRLALYGPEQRMVFGATTFRQFVEMLGSNDEATGVGDPWVGQMRRLPTTVVSTSLREPLAWPDATVAGGGDAVEIVDRMKGESDVPIRSHGSLSMNRALMAAGVVDLIQVSLFPVITGNSGDQPIFGGAADFDLELIEQRTFDGRTQELVYRPTRHG